MNAKQEYSSTVLKNYNISKLYANSLNSDFSPPESKVYVIGIISIPKINVYYPIFSNCNDDLLKIAPCRFYGTTPGKNGNLCIAGHNYDNNKFFSKISTLNIDDEITIFDYSNSSFAYTVYDIYEVNEKDMSPIYNYNKKEKLLTLITCNNINKNRIIVKAICKF